MLHSLPGDLLGHIFSFLPPPAFVALCCVSRGLHVALQTSAEPILRALYLQCCGQATGAVTSHDALPWRLRLQLLCALRRPTRVRCAAVDEVGDEEGPASVDCTLRSLQLRAYGTSSGEVHVFAAAGSLLRHCAFLLGHGSVRHMQWVRSAGGRISGLLVGSWGSTVHLVRLDAFLAGTLDPLRAGEAVVLVAALGAGAGPVFSLLALPFSTHTSGRGFDCGATASSSRGRSRTSSSGESIISGAGSGGDAAGGGAGSRSTSPLMVDGVEAAMGGTGNAADALLPRALAVSAGLHIHVADVRSGCVQVLRGHTEGVTDLALLCPPHHQPQQPRLLCSASYDGDVRVWDLGAHMGTASSSSSSSSSSSGGGAGAAATHTQPPPTPCAVLKGHRGPVWSVCVCPAASPGAFLLYSAGSDGTVRRWLVPTASFSAAQPECSGCQASVVISRCTVLKPPCIDGSTSSTSSTSTSTSTSTSATNSSSISSTAQIMCLHLAHSTLLAGNSHGEVHAWHAQSGKYLWGVCSGSALGASVLAGRSAQPMQQQQQQQQHGSRDAVRRLEAVGSSVYMCMRSGKCLVLNLGTGSLPRLQAEWEAAVVEEGGRAGGQGAPLAAARP